MRRLHGRLVLRRGGGLAAAVPIIALQRAVNRINRKNDRVLGETGREIDRKTTRNPNIRHPILLHKNDQK